jgi:tRNA(fMet)-specific endonuclease VapC
LSFLLDTDTCSAHLKGDPVVFNRFIQYGGGLHVSVLTVGELLTWALRAKAPPQRRQDVQGLLTAVAVFDVTPDVAVKFGEVRAALLDGGRPVPEVDLFIASTALVHRLVLVTHNVADYANVPGLTVVDWLVP